MSHIVIPSSSTLPIAGELHLGHTYMGTKCGLPADKGVWFRLDGDCPLCLAVQRTHWWQWGKRRALKQCPRDLFAVTHATEGS